MDDEPLVFEWPDTGRLEIHPAGKRVVVLRFSPSKAAILDGLRKAMPRTRLSYSPTGAVESTMPVTVISFKILAPAGTSFLAAGNDTL